MQSTSKKGDAETKSTLSEVELFRERKAIEAEPLGIDMKRSLRFCGQPAHELRPNLRTRSTGFGFLGVERTGRVAQHFYLGFRKVGVEPGVGKLEE